MAATNEPTELEIKRAQKGSLKSIEIVITKTSPYVLALCRKWCRPPLDANDVAQDSLIRIVDKIATYEFKSQFFSWVYTVSYRTFLDNYRLIKRREKIALKHANQQVNEHAQDSEVDGPDLSQALNSLSDQHAQILILIDASGSTYEEVATMLDIPVGTVRSRLARARIALRSALVEQGTFPSYYDVSQIDGDEK